MEAVPKGGEEPGRRSQIFRMQNRFFREGFQMEATGGQMILGLLVGIFALVFLVLRTKVHAFPALIIAASLTGLIGGMTPPEDRKSTRLNSSHVKISYAVFS